MIVESFRNKKVPRGIKTKLDLIAWVLIEFREDEPISNGEFVYDLHCHRFGGLLHILREQGWEIATVKGKKKGHFVYYLLRVPMNEAHALDNKIRKASYTTATAFGNSMTIGNKYPERLKVVEKDVIYTVDTKTNQMKLIQ